MGSDLLSTFLITRLAFICPVPLFRSNSASLSLCYLWSLPITWAAFPSSLFLWLKPESHNLTTLVTASVKRSLLSRIYSLVMGTHVHEKITSGRKQGMKWDENAVKISAMAYPSLDLTLLTWKTGVNPLWSAPLIGFQWKTDEMVYMGSFLSTTNQLYKKRVSLVKL